MTADLVAFLRARLDEDEQRARQAATIADPQRGLMPRWSGRPYRNGWTVTLLNPDTADDLDTGIDLFQAELPKTVAEHIIFNDPERVLAEVDAKRRIIKRHLQRRAPNWDYPGHIGYECAQCTNEYPCPTLALLALPYRDHPDYQPEWAPDTEG